MPEYLTVPQAARRLGVSARHVRNEAAAGRIPGAILAPGRWLIPAASLDAIRRPVPPFGFPKGEKRAGQRGKLVRP